MVIVILFAALSIGCGAKSDNEKEKPQGVIPQYQLKTLEKAKEVNKIMRDATTERDAALKKE
jgi:hypothetical protein